MPPIDPAILQALSLNDSDNATLTSHGGSSFTSTYKLTTQDSNGKEKCYFLKVGKGEDAKAMLAGEHHSLNALHDTVANLAPRSYSHGPLDSKPNEYYLLTDFLPPSRSHASSLSKEQSLVYKLATLHSTPAPIPEGHDTARFGFPLPTYCGNTRQTNTWCSTWADFYSSCRIRPIFESIEQNHGTDPELKSLVANIVDKIIPRLLSSGHLTTSSGEDIKPVLVHGDLWSGNHGRFLSLERTDGEEGREEEMVFDASSCFAHSEFEFGIMRMFNGFGRSFEEEYFKYKIGGRDRPVEEWEDRVRLYELYHHLNHYSMFGGGYRGSAVQIMKNLINKYGSGS